MTSRTAARSATTAIVVVLALTATGCGGSAKPGAHPSSPSTPTTSAVAIATSGAPAAAGTAQAGFRAAEQAVLPALTHAQQVASSGKVADRRLALASLRTAISALDAAIRSVRVPASVAGKVSAVLDADQALIDALEAQIATTTNAAFLAVNDVTVTATHAMTDALAALDAALTRVVAHGG